MNLYKVGVCNDLNTFQKKQKNFIYSFSSFSEQWRAYFNKVEDTCIKGKMTENPVF